MKKLLGLSAALALSAAIAAPAQALEFSSSSTTGEGLIFVPFRTETPRIGPISVDGGVRFAPFLSKGLGAANVNPGYTEVTSSLFDVSTNLYYHHELANVELLGRFNPVIAPYVGARYLGAPTSEVNAALTNPAAALSYSQFGGLNYGLRAYSELPLGFNTYAHAGLTTLMTGGWDTRANSTSVTASGKTATRNMTLPSFGVGLGWNFFNVVALSVGYELFTLPTGLRDQSGSLPSSQTSLNTLSVGARILFFSI